ncbi:fluoride efflux transporter CrcB [Metabacillus malikii]|uniref:Fluoride-specific ion channel FluC n=1 Tax=Metabacillus malikii TaxID=1504265 RepID=A0ABT9ZB83_9BACI|nr:fluoride efflux transporter CrcB [Metabacillus malikii]MDQ0229528.1 CrcB protein [Metabacillus malikii]
MIEVLIGGGLEAAFRYIISEYFNSRHRHNKIPLAIMFINWLGSFLLGIFVTIPLEEQFLLLLATGFCGGFTTFSTFSVEAVQLIQRKQYRHCFLYITMTVSGSIAGLMLGMLLFY